MFLGMVALYMSKIMHDSESFVYRGKDTQLSLTDADLLDGASLEAIMKTTCQNDDDTVRRGLRVEFTLGSSTYATMAIRELTHGGATGKVAVET